MKAFLTSILFCLALSTFAQSKVVKGQITEYNVSTEKTYQVTGIVSDEQDKPINQVRVMVKDGVSSATTNSKGEYSITIGANDKALRFYYPEMVITELPIGI
jgi:hypothetical protein